jgi:hypothetical protein
MKKLLRKTLATLPILLLLFPVLASAAKYDVHYRYEGQGPGLGNIHFQGKKLTNQKCIENASTIYCEGIIENLSLPKQFNLNLEGINLKLDFYVKLQEKIHAYTDTETGQRVFKEMGPPKILEVIKINLCERCENKFIYNEDINF